MRDHREPLERDLFKVGRTLDEVGTPALRWDQLYVFVRWSDESDAIHRALNERWMQTTDNDLLRSMELSLRRLVWMQTKEGRRGANQPKLNLWPWEEAEERRKNSLRGDSMTMEDAAKMLGWTDSYIAQRNAEADAELQAARYSEATDEQGD